MYFRHFVKMLWLRTPNCKLYLASGFRLTTFLLADNRKLIWQLNRGEASSGFERLRPSNDPPEDIGKEDREEFARKKPDLFRGGYLEGDWSKHYSINGLFVIDDASQRIVEPFREHYTSCAPKVEVDLADLKFVLTKRLIASSIFDLIFLEKPDEIQEWLNLYDEIKKQL